MMDWLKEAKDYYNKAIDVADTLDEERTFALDAIAAALIALVERRPQFVQIGDDRFPVDSITHIEQYTVDGVLGLNVHIPYYTIQLKGQAAMAFLQWHKQAADVVRLEAE